MKKFVRILLCLTLVLSISMMFACGGDPSGNLFDGNYSVEATDADITNANAILASDALLGENERVGFEFSLDASTNVSSNSTFGSMTMASSVEYDVKLSVNTADAKNPENIANSLKMSMTLDTSASASMSAGDISDSESSAANGSIYADSTGFYINATNTENGESETVKGRLELEDALGDLMGGGMVLDAQTPPDLSTMDLAGILSAASESGAKIYIDNSNGTKIKISFTKESLTTMIGEEPTGLDLDGLTISACDIYISVDANGVLAGLKADVDISINASDPISGTSAMTYQISLLAQVKDVTINTPSDLDTYEDLFTMPDFPGFGGF